MHSGASDGGEIGEAQAGQRCGWCLSSPDYVTYHDTEWGFPVTDDRRLFEKVCLEGFQAGLSWLTILRKRENFRAAFAGFDFEKVARFTERDVDRLLGDAGIIRHRGKIEAVIRNAGLAREVVAECGSLAAYFWRWVPDPRTRPRRVTAEVLRSLTTSPVAVALSKDLRRRGWSFVGPTTMYAFMQAMGLVNDHVEGCPVREVAERARERVVGRVPGASGVSVGRARARSARAPEGRRTPGTLRVRRGGA